MSPRISVLTPAYDEGPNVLVAYASLLNQTITEWEWIVVDDGSHQPLAPLLEPVEDERIKIVTLPQNRGRGAARQIAYEHASAEFIALQDADDWSHPARLEAVLDRLSSSPQIKVVASRMFVETDRTVLVSPQATRHLNHPTLAFARSVMDSVTYPQQRKVAEDYGFTMQLKSRFVTETLDRPLYVYRAHSSHSLSKYAQTQWAVWQTDRSLSASSQVITAISRAGRVAAYGLAHIVGMQRYLIRRRYSRPTPAERTDYENARSVIFGSFTS